jgi:hypothetical protein
MVVAAVAVVGRRRFCMVVTIRTKIEAFTGYHVMQ